MVITSGFCNRTGIFSTGETYPRQNRRHHKRQRHSALAAQSDDIQQAKAYQRQPVNHHHVRNKTALTNRRRIWVCPNADSQRRVARKVATISAGTALPAKSAGGDGDQQRSGVLFTLAGDGQRSDDHHANSGDHGDREGTTNHL